MYKAHSKRRCRKIIIALVPAFCIVYVFIYMQCPLFNIPTPKNPAISTKKLFLATPMFMSRWHMNFDECPVNDCVTTEDFYAADAVVFHNYEIQPWLWWYSTFYQRPPNQKWIFFGQESEVRTAWDSASLNNIFNWTATYKRTSDIVVPYGGYTRLTQQEQMTLRKKTFDYARGKSKLAMILSSHCGALTSGRWELVEELQKYINIDVFGKCHNTPCPEPCNIEEMGKQYKFYLSFENSRCEDYITEKFWGNALGSGEMVPIVLGGYNKTDYSDVSPPNSFIHATDFKTPRELANYMLLLDKEDALYNEYHRWRRTHKVFKQKIVNKDCSFCKNLHNATKFEKHSIHKDLHTFWNRQTNCKVINLPSDSFHNAVISYTRYLFGII
ncbi:unnamed protein product [Owenia fusiformis]|uniref:Fucosyltransferase n=1 Tax=Owenia fusiformis TaxID=6347 RepID=A0A8J1TC82_OWEFU|nr:unnamed protein product [Owenia fusiformis]